MRTAILTLSFGAVALGLAVPETANRLGHALVAVLAIGALVTLVQPAITRWEITRAGPFTDGDGERPASLTPVVIGEIADEIASPGRVLSPKLIGRLRTIATSRLADRDDVDISVVLRTVVDGAVDDDGIRITALDSLLTELESL